MTDDEQALYASLLIGIGRVYDVLLSIYSEQNADKAKALRKMHEEGHLFFPPPAYLNDED